MYFGVDHKEASVLKNWCFWIVVLEKTLENPLCRKIKPVNPKENQFWIFIQWTDAEAEAPILWPSNEKNHLFGKTLMLRKIEVKNKRGGRRWDCITDTIDTNLSKLQEIVEFKEAWYAIVHVFSKNGTWLGDWTKITTLATTLATRLIILK